MGGSAEGVRFSLAVFEAMDENVLSYTGSKKLVLRYAFFVKFDKSACFEQHGHAHSITKYTFKDSYLFFIYF